MSSLQPTITLAQLTTGPTIDSRTITVWLQLAFSGGYYTVGGVQSGIQAFVSGLGVDDAHYLGSFIEGEETVTATVGGVRYKYIFDTDKIQLFSAAGVEFTASQAIPVTVLNDIIVGNFTYNRI